MLHTGPILLIDDDQDDLDFLQEIFDDLGVKNEIRQFLSCPDAFEYLTGDTSNPFLILCDVNIAGMNGIEFKTKIDQNPMLRAKSVPFIFFSTSQSQSTVVEMYAKLHIQGYFSKPANMQDLTVLIKRIIDYWTLAELPGDTELRTAAENNHA